MEFFFRFVRLVSACFWLPSFLKKWEMEENRLIAEQYLAAQEQQQKEMDMQKDEKEASSTEDNTDSEKSKEEFERIPEVEIDNEAKKTK